MFGTINAALAGGLAANRNGMVTIVTSGTFIETVNITGANGNLGSVRSRVEAGYVEHSARPGLRSNYYPNFRQSP